MDTANSATSSPAPYRQSDREPGAELSIGICSDVAVSGARGSTTALTTALACAHAGFSDITVYHGTRDERPDQSVELSPNASRVLRALNMLDDIEEHCFEPQFLHQRSYRTGFQLSTLALGAMAEGRYHAPFLHVSESTLSSALGNRAETAGIKLAPALATSTLTQNDNRVHVNVADQSSSQPTAPTKAAHDVLLVANDPQQLVRQAANAETLTTQTSPWELWHGRVARSALPSGAFGAVLTRWVGPQHHLSYHLTGDGEQLEFHASIDTRDTAIAGLTGIARLEAAFSNWHNSLRELLKTNSSATGAPQQIPLAPLSSPERLAHGNILFLGASCHELPPHLPQQHAMGLEDAWVISRMLEQWEDEPASGLIEYEKYRLPRARRLQARAHELAASLCMTEGLKSWQRNFGLSLGSRFLPELAMQKNDWLYGYDAVNGFE